MKIALLTSIGNTIDAFLPPIVDRWTQLGHEVCTASSTDSAIGHHTHLKSLTRNPSPRNIWAHREIEDWLTSEQADVLVTNTAVASFVARTKRLPCPVVYFCHGLHWNSGTRPTDKIWQSLEQRSLKNTAGVITINSDDEEWFQGKLSDDVVARLPAGVGVPVSDFRRSDLPPIRERIDLLWAGEFSKRKRPWLAVDMIGDLSKLHPGVHLTMCGRGPLLERIKKQAQTTGLDGKITFPGRVSIPQYLERSHALVMTSAWEGLPRIALEANAIGRPVFALDVKGVRSLPQVVLADESDPQDLLQKVSASIDRGLADFEPVDPDALGSSRAAEQMLSLIDRVLSSQQRSYAG